MGHDAYLGRTIDDRYVIHRLLGRGGMGAVYEARHTGLDRRVAVKFLISETATPDELERFRREARSAARIDHENVVRIYDTGTDNGVPFIAMELVDGTDLRRLLASEGTLTPPRAVELTRQILAGLHAIHDEGIVHRDIKPSNLVVTRIAGREVIKIMDFGISKSREPGLTATGSAVGTPEYMSPEQRSGEVVDHRADLFAVGVTLHVMLTGHLPSEALTARGASRLPVELAPVVARALARAPADRFSSAREFAAALVNPVLTARDDAALAATHPATVRDSPRARARDGSATTPDVPKRSPWPLAIIVVAVVAALGAVGWQLARRTPASPPAVAAASADAGSLATAADAAPLAAPIVTAAPMAAGANVEATVDAGIATTTPPRAKGLYCMCFNAVSLCPAKAKAPLCNCRASTAGMFGPPLCSVAHASDKDCPDPDFGRLLAGKHPGESCEGFFRKHAKQGAFACTWCQGVQLRAYRGQRGDPCHGYDRHTGVRTRGELDNCTDDPNDKVVEK